MQIRSRNGSCSHEPITTRVGESPVGCTSLLQETSLPFQSPGCSDKRHMSNQSTLAHQWKQTRHHTAVPVFRPPGRCHPQHPAMQADGQANFRRRHSSMSCCYYDHPPPPPLPLPARSSLIPQQARRPLALLLPTSPRCPRLRTLLRLLLLRRGRIPGALRGNTGRGRVRRGRRGTRAVTCCCRRLYVAQRTERRHARPCLEATSGFGLHVLVQWVIQPAALYK